MVCSISFSSDGIFNDEQKIADGFITLAVHVLWVRSLSAENTGGASE